MEKIEEILKHYLIAALWTGDLASEFDTEDFEEDSIESSRKDIISFVEKAGTLLGELEPSQIGHDFWLTRNRHGVGFWDREYLPKEIKEKLTEICHLFDEVNIDVENDCVFLY